jgi:hypothetical protein
MFGGWHLKGPCTPPSLSLGDLTEPEREAWQAALQVYRPLANRLLLFDETLVQIDNRLVAVKDVQDVDAVGIEPNLAHALNSAAPSTGPTSGQVNSTKTTSGSLPGAPDMARHAASMRLRANRLFRTYVHLCR